MVGWNAPTFGVDVPPSDPLPSWSSGPIKQALVDFVARVTAPGSKDFVPIPERIAVFDHDGTLWVEQPVHPQLAFVVDRVRAHAPHFPGWRTKQPFKAAIEGDYTTLARAGSAAVMQLAIATQAGLSTEQTASLAEQWLARARHPRFHRAYTDLTYAPMRELLDHLRLHGFKTWIVTAGGADFVRTFSERVYGIPPEQVIGSSLKTQFDQSADRSALIQLPQVAYVNNRDGKPIAIQRVIGRRPILAFGNSDGDLQMLQWSTSGTRPHLAAVIHHTDGSREWAYDRRSPVGTLDVALREASQRGWLVVDMKRDWRRLFPSDP
jgi:phosphoglycolate phosphatase-like HAD superfamily hydrolase